MKCLTVRQPWATLLVLGIKHFETRSWRTSYRGRLAIQAGRTFSEEARALCLEEPFRSALVQAGYRYPADLPTRAILGSVEVIDCVPAEIIARLWPAGCPELRFGDFRPGRWAWRVENAIAFPTPRRLIGRPGLFDIPELMTT